jgi:hypothetical protein
MATVRHLGLLPFCITPKNPQEAEFPFYFSVGLDLRTLLMFFWRIKAWRLEVSFVGPLSQNVVASDVVQNQYGFEIDSEKKLVCSTGYSFSATNDLLGGGQETTYGFDLFGAELNDEQTAVFFYEGKYYPQIVSVFASNPTDTEHTWNGTTLSVANPQGYLNYLRATPAEYWPYDPDDGLGPIYDKDTGAQLRAFPA